jgi:hypothetical protein
MQQDTTGCIVSNRMQHDTGKATATQYRESNGIKHDTGKATATRYRESYKVQHDTGKAMGCNRMHRK